MVSKKRASGLEWSGGLVTLPGYVNDDGKPFRAQAVVWMGSRGAILGAAVGRSDNILSQACESLGATIENPITGPVHTPTRVRVSSRELAEALRVAHPAIDIVCGPTPELDAVADGMAEFLARDLEGSASYLGGDADAAAIESFFHAAADLHRAAPWNIVPDDMSLFSVTIESLGVEDAVISTIGQHGESFGFVLFNSVDDLCAFQDAAVAHGLDLERDTIPKFPAHRSLNFENVDEVDSSLLAEIEEHEWEIADEDAYPIVYIFDDELKARPPLANELLQIEVIARALPLALASTESPQDAWFGGPPIETTHVVSTHAGEVEVTLRTSNSSDNGDVLDQLEALDGDNGELDGDARQDLEQRLLAEFLASPEGVDMVENCNPIMCLPIVLNLAADYLSKTVPTITSGDLHEVIMELFPRKVTIEASAAAPIIAELRAFYSFLEREYQFRGASACLRLLDDGAREELEAGLSNPSNFGLAKSVVTAARVAGLSLDRPAPPERQVTAKRKKASRAKRNAQQRKRKR